MELKDKAILVTGGTSGVGKAIAQGLACLAAGKEVDGVSGVLFDDRKRIVPIHESVDAELKSALWRACEELVVD